MKLHPHRCLLVVSDMDSSLAFYRDLLGMRLTRDAVREGPSYDEILQTDGARVRVAFVEAEADGYPLELVEYLRPKSRKASRKMSDVGAVRLCFEVDSVARTLNTLKRRGLRQWRGPIILERDGAKVAKLLYVSDPDDIEVEFIQML